ncbi:hemerythrin domain-containing protein [[Actinomadura] parvosata]|uniref:hemerythrin domain-containing protein n=1 Tax=[Actinomadura] parvosata TaxID=1955412 RepID=UPI00406C2ECA
MSVETEGVEIEGVETVQRVVRRVFRRESRLLMVLVAAVRPGDTARAGVIAGHFRLYRLGLHRHHQAQEELLWRPLLARLDLEADVVLRTQARHERVAATLARLDAAVAAWEAAAGGDERDTLVAVLCDHRAVLLEHLDDEEAALLPLAARHLTEREWARLGERLVDGLARPALFGAVLEEASPAERALVLRGLVLRGLPAAARAVWYVVGRPRYARHLRRVRG